MRVTLVCPYSFDLPGGVQNQVRGLSSALARAGHEVSVIAPGTSRSRSLVGEAVELVLVGTSIAIPVNGSQAPIAPYPAAFSRTRRALSRLSPDLVHVHEPFVPGPAMAAVLGARVPLLGTFHRSGAGTAYRLIGPALRRLFDRLDLAVAVSDAARQTLEDVLRSKPTILVAFNGIDLSRFSASPSTARNPRSVVFVGRHEKRKGLSVLLDACSRMTEQFSLVVVGEGPESQGLREEFGGDARITFTGRLSDKEVTAVLEQAELLVAPALYGESFGVVLLEAMAAGAGVIASDIAGYRQAAGDAAVYVRPGDPDAIAEAIRALFGDEPARAALVTAGRERSKDFSFDALAGIYLDHYSRLVRTSPARRLGGGVASP